MTDMWEEFDIGDDPMPKPRMTAGGVAKTGDHAPVIGGPLPAGMALEKPRPAQEFSTGATRDTDDDKPDYEGFLSPLVIERFGQYMHKHRVQSDGKLRDSDNWQKGIPKDKYMKSHWRHFFDAWSLHRFPDQEIRSKEGEVIGIEDALCGDIFNAQGHLHEILVAKMKAAAEKDGENS